MKVRFCLFLLIGLIMILGCIGPTSPGMASVSLQGAGAEKSRLLLATKTHTKTPTKTPTKRPTKTPTRKPTNTPLPPLPDFIEAITFSPGAGGGVCPGPEQLSNKIDASGGSDVVYACIWLKGIDHSKPFKIYLSPANNSSGNPFVSPDLFLDASNGKIRWDRYGDWDTFIRWEEKNGVLAIYAIGISVPKRLSPGSWHIFVVQEGSTFGTYGSDFQVSENVSNDDPYISAATRPAAELTPFEPIALRKIVTAKSNGKIDVVGEAFPKNTLVYVLVYQQISEGSGEMKLASKQAVIANSSGVIHAELAGSLGVGQTYLLVGITDPHTALVDANNRFNFNNHNIAYEQFQVVPASKPVQAKSCPGAPAQRMVVNQRGYVCTKSDQVRLRASPSRSARTIAMLPTGARFTVLDGPSCANNWSWWQIKTDDGYSGWISEGGDAVDPYFICTSP